jgi:hypothetical protein
MKLEPIINPHARIWQVTKKSKAEEKDELIEATKKTAIEKYGKKSGGNRKFMATANMTGSGNNFTQKTDQFTLKDQVTPESQSHKLLQEGSL